MYTDHSSKDYSTRLSLLTFLYSCPTDLQSVAGSYGNPPVKLVRLSVDSNVIFIPDPSHVIFVWHMPSKRKDELFFLLHLCHLPACPYPCCDTTTPVTVFSQRKAFRQTFHTPNPCGSSAFEDEEWSSPRETSKGTSGRHCCCWGLGLTISTSHS